ncbi:hypothetical protein [Flavobacterium sp. CS20]|uniref:hypothetical protein n=1 Tax=Flavobacterium sp. CS20 TaxID=2775246 RepID=UPI001B3A2BFF|nr:hypothetical protein [Flavobacterium sp. CS20]QTY25967.1 hypothetical protein IGB25_08055 [Flavobacterium sp. CS20]
MKLLDYINLSTRQNELVNWNIALITKGKGETYNLGLNGISQIGCVVRSNDEAKADTENLHIIKNHIIRPKDEFFDLSDAEYEQALERTREYYQSQSKNYKYSFPKGEIVRNEFRNPETALLLIYFIDAEKAGMPVGSKPIVGFAVSFPKSIHSHSVPYAVNNELLPYFNIDDTDDFDDDEN